MKTPAISIALSLLIAYSSLNAQKPNRRPGSNGIVKPRIEDTVRVNVYADNWFQLYINGQLIATDSISFMPHNVVSVDILPDFPMTIAVMAKDNADPQTGLEYNNSSIGDGGFILKIGDEIVSNKTWKAKNFFHGPVDGNMQNPKVTYTPIPQNWHAIDFDDSSWPHASEHPEGAVRPKGPFYQHDFEGAKFIWTEDLELDNTILFRARIEKPDWQPRWNTKPDLDTSQAPRK